MFSRARLVMTLLAICKANSLPDWPRSHAYLLADIVRHYSSLCECEKKKMERYLTLGEAPSLREVISCPFVSILDLCSPLYPLFLVSLFLSLSKEHTHRESTWGSGLRRSGSSPFVLWQRPGLCQSGKE